MPSFSFQECSVNNIKVLGIFYENFSFVCFEKYNYNYYFYLQIHWSRFNHQDLKHTNAEKGANLGSIL